jgi:hypothetical protein
MRKAQERGSPAGPYPPCIGSNYANYANDPNMRVELHVPVWKEKHKSNTMEKESTQ